MGQFPNQQLTERQKIKEFGSVKEWGRSVLQSVQDLSSYSIMNTPNYEKEILLKLAYGEIDTTDFNYCLKEFGDLDVDYTAKFRHFDRISPFLNKIQGDAIETPFDYSIIAIDEFSSSEILKKKNEEINQYLESYIISIIADNEEEFRLAVEEGRIIPPESIDEYMNTTYKSKKEITANRIFDYLKNNLSLRNVFVDGVFDLVTYGDEIYYTGVHNGDPIIRKVDPRYFKCDKRGNIKNIEDCSWAIEYEFVPASSIYDANGYDLSSDDVKYIESLKGTKDYVGYYQNTLEDNTNLNNNFGFFTKNNTIVKKTYFVWKGLRKMGFVTYFDEETNSILEKEVDDTYKRNDFDIDIEWKWINETWELEQVGELIIKCNPRSNQYRDINNPFKTRLPYTGISDIRLSQVNKLKHLNYLYDIYMWRLEIETSKAMGRVLLFDTAQIPTSEGMDIDKWLYFLKSKGIAFINSFEEGTGRFVGETSKFNQFNAIDLSLSQSISQYIGLLNKLDAMMQDITGISQQSLSQIGASETATGVMASIKQTNTVTQYILFEHDEVVRKAITNLLEESKMAYKSGKLLQFVGDDLTRTIIEIDEGYLNSSYGVFASNNIINKEIRQFIIQNAQAALQNGQASFVDVIKILQTNSVGLGVKILENSRNSAMQNAQEQQAKEQESQQIMLKMEKDFEIEKILLEQEHESIENQLDREKDIMLGSQTNNPLEGIRINYEKEKDIRKQNIELRKIQSKESIERLKSLTQITVAKENMTNEEIKSKKTNK